MKHGPIALIDPLMPVVFIASRSDPNYRKIVNNVQEVLSRKGSIIVVTEEVRGCCLATCWKSLPTLRRASPTLVALVTEQPRL